MEILLARPDSGTRIFPSVEPELYSFAPLLEGDSPRQDFAHEALRLAHAPLTRWQRLAGGNLDPLGKVKRLLHFHRLAFEAEIAGEYVRGDFFWTHFHELLPAAFRDPACARALTAAVSANFNTPELLRRRLVDEVFIDTHLGFLNGRLSSGALAADDRAFQHAAYIERLLPWSGLDSDNRIALQQAIARRRIEASGAAGRWEDAAAECSRAIEREPQSCEFQDRFVECVLVGALSRLNQSNSQTDIGREAVLLKNGIDKLETFRQRFSNNPAVYDALGHLWAARAARLARLQRLPEGLVNMDLALACDPLLEGGDELQETLFNAMEQLQQQMLTIEKEIRQRPGTTLSAEGLQLQRQAREGFQPLETFRASGEAERIQEGRARAIALRLWHDLELPEPTPEQEPNALLLLAAINDVLRDPPEDTEGLTRRWAEAKEDAPNLASLDPEPILRFLRSRLFETAEKDAPSPEPQPIASTVPEIPRLVSGFARRQRSEPLGYWVFSRRDLRVKLQAAVAILLLGTLGVLSGREEIHRYRRDAAYAQLLAARDRNDDIQIMDAAEAFLANPLIAQDGREGRVEDLYSEAVVRTVLDGAPLDPALKNHLDRYQQLVIPGPEAEQ